MEFWVKFWTVFFIISLVIFAGLAVAVTIGGFFNIRSLFKSLEEEHTYRKDQEDIDVGA